MLTHGLAPTSQVRSDRGSAHIGERAPSAKSGKRIPPTVHDSKRDRTNLRVTTSSQGEPRQFAEGDVPDPAFLLFRVQSGRGDVEGDVDPEHGRRRGRTVPHRAPEVQWSLICLSRNL